MLTIGTTALKVTDELGTGVHGGDAAASIERAIARGEYRDALARSARAYGPSLGRLCMAYTGSQAEAEELVQETLLSAYDAFPQFRGDGSVKSFLYGIARKTCARAVEKKTRRDARLRLVTDDERADDASDGVIAKQRAERTRSALNELRPTEREALLLRFEGELSFREVAEACGCDEPAARKRVSRAISRLRELMGEEA